MEKDDVLKAENNKSIKEQFFSVSKKDFARSLSHIQSVVERKNIMPILANVMISTVGGALKLIATDMDILVSETIAAQVYLESATTVNARTLYDIVRKLDDRYDIEVTIMSGTGNINIASGKSNFILPTLPIADFPQLEGGHYENTFQIPSSELARLIDECKFSMSTEETRYNLNGLYLHQHNGCIRVVATDGHRLCLSDSKATSDLKDFTGVIIPKKTIMELRKIIDELDKNINISLSHNKICFSGEGFSLLSKLVDATFPDYQMLIPDENKVQIRVSAAEFNSVVDRVSTVTNEKFRGIKFLLDHNTLTLSASDNTGNYAEERIVVESSSEGKLEVGFNYRYVLDVMSVINGEYVICSFRDPFSSAVIEDASNPNFKYIVMPMRV